MSIIQGSHGFAIRSLVGAESVHFQGDNSARSDLLIPVDPQAERSSLPVTLGDEFYNNMPRSQYAVPNGPVFPNSKLPGQRVAQNTAVVKHLPLLINPLTIGRILTLEGVPDDKLANVFEGIYTANDTLGGGAMVTAEHGKVTKNGSIGETETLFQINNGTDKQLFVDWAGNIHSETQVTVDRNETMAELLRHVGITNRAELGAMQMRVDEAVKQIRGDASDSFAFAFSPENPGALLVRRQKLVNPEVERGLVDPRGQPGKKLLIGIVADQRIVARVGDEFKIFRDWNEYHTRIGAR